MRDSLNCFCSKAVLLLHLIDPLMVKHSCYFLNELVIGASSQRSNLLKEWIDSGTVVPVFLWAGSPSSTPSKISRRKKKNQLAETSNTKQPLCQDLSSNASHTIFPLNTCPTHRQGKGERKHCVTLNVFKFFNLQSMTFQANSIKKCSE